MNRAPKPNFRGMLDYFMALAMIMMGAFIIFSEKFLGYDYFRNSSIVKGGMKWLIGALFMLYGLFRAYRGYTSSKSSNQDD